MGEGAEGDGGSSSAAGDKGGADKKEESGKHKKLLRLLTVFAYLSTVSGTAFMLSLYYLFLWTPKVQLGGKALVQDPPPPGTLSLFYPEMAPHLAARVADEEKAAEWTSRTATPGGRTRKSGGDASESQLPASPQLALPASSLRDGAEAGKRREARSTLMEMTTTPQQATPPATPASNQRAEARLLGGQQPSSLPPPLVQGGAAGGAVQRTKNKGGGEQQQRTPWAGTTPRPAAHA